MRVLEQRITEREAGRTVKSVVLKELRVSRGQFSHLKFAGGVWVDGKEARADQRLHAGQMLRLILRDEEAAPLIPWDIPVHIPFMDEDVFVIDKPAPLPTLSSAHQQGPTLENALYAHLGCPPDYVFRPVNRLDKGTSGLLAVARNAHAQQLLQRMLHTDAFVREYLAVCQGHLPESEGVIDDPIGRLENSVKRVISPDGLPARTHYRIVAETENLSLVRLRLETGRTHQIRVHLAAAGCPIVGDYLYNPSGADPRLPGRFALHACRLALTHPITGARVAVCSPLPDDLSAIVNEGDKCFPINEGEGTRLVDDKRENVL